MSVFYSFHYEHDAARVQQVMNMGVLDGQPLLNSQDWESVRKQGDAAIKKWINDQMAYKSAVVVLVGAETASRPWVRYEIAKAWDDKRPLVGIRINKLAPLSLDQDPNGANPFSQVTLKDGGTVGDFVTLHTPVGSTGKDVYASISENLKAWADGAYKRS